MIYSSYKKKVISKDEALSLVNNICDDELLAQDILETRYHVQRPNPVKVIVWGAVAYGICFGLAGGLSAFTVLPLSRLPLVMMLLVH